MYNTRNIIELANGSILIIGLFLSFIGVILVVWPYFSRDYWDRLHGKIGVYTEEGIKRMDTVGGSQRLLASSFCLLDSWYNSKLLLMTDVEREKLSLRAVFFRLAS